MEATGRTLVLSVLIIMLSVGCDDGSDRRASVKFHTTGVRQIIESLKTELNRDAEGARGSLRERIEAASLRLGQALYRLPARLEAKAETRKAERVAAANKAKDLYEGFRAQLISGKLDKDQAIAKFDELLAILDEVDKP